MKSILIGSLLASFSALACPDLSGDYHASYMILGDRYDVLSHVTQEGCQSMQVVNSIKGPHGTQQNMNKWIADGVFRRKDPTVMVSAVFTDQALVTTEVVSIVDASVQTNIQRNFMSRKETVHLDASGNLVNDEQRYDDQGVLIGTSQFTYQKAPQAQ